MAESNPEIAMHTSTINESTCCGCHFTPFCIGNEKLRNDPQSNTLPIKRRFIIKKNERLFSPNSHFQYLFAIEKGSVKTVQSEADGSELIRGFYFSGEILGYEAIYTGRYNFSAIALTETHICMLDYHDFLYFLQTNPELQQHILYLISLQLNVGSYLASTKADRKLACYLLDLSTRLHRANMHNEFELPMSRQDIGNYLRLTAETISRTLTRLQQKKFISIKNKKVSLLQVNALKEIADGLHSIERDI